jgi:RNA-directed DNA polymerase
MKRAGSSCRRVTRPAKNPDGLTCGEGLNQNDEFEFFCSSSGYTPSGVALGWREESSLSSGSDLLEAILDAQNVSLAWKQVKANRGAAGVDGVSVHDFPELFRGHWPKLRDELVSGTYVPQAVRRVEIDKPDGGKRLLGIPTVLDRVIQQSIAQVLGPILDPGFSEYSFGFRPKRSAHQAVRHLSEVIKSGRRIAVDLDLSKFFDRVDHDVLMCRLARKVSDRRVLRLIGKYLRAGVMIETRLEQTREGVPQGGPLSPLLANVVLDDLDKELEGRGHRFARYADDFIILVKSQRAGQRVMVSVSRFLERKLKLKVNQAKSKVVKTAQLEFLGFAFYGSRIKWSNKSFSVLKWHLRRLTGRSWGVSISWRLEKLAQYMRGWIGYYGIAEGFGLCRSLDNWIRRRVRCCYWKQWKTIRNRIRKLLNLGVQRRDALLTAITSNGYWVMSKTPVINGALSNQWLAKQGLVSLAQMWANIHYPTTVR